MNNDAMSNEGYVTSDVLPTSPHLVASMPQPDNAPG